MPKLFGRVCRVTVGAQIGAIRAGLRVEGHRVAFNVEKTLKPEPNQATIQIWNLSREQRGQIEELRPKSGDARGVPLLLEAGYRDTGLTQIFLGDMRTVYSTYEKPDWITTLESGDGEKAHQNARVATALGPGTSPDTALRAIVKALGLGDGNVAAVLAKLRVSGVAQLFARRAVITGSAAVHMTNFCKSAGLEWSIQDGAIQILDRGKALAGFAVVLDKTSGLVGSPTVDHEGVLACQMLIQPDVRPGSLLVVNSAAAAGNYRIERAIWEGDTHGTPWYITAEAKRY